MSKLALLALAVTATPATGQPAQWIAEAREVGSMAPTKALGLLGRALAADSNIYEAQWRAAVALVDLGLETPDSIRSTARDSLFLEAEYHARRAVALDPDHVEGHFALAMALGRVALTKSRKDRIRYAKEIYEVANRALAIAPEHDGVHHILGLWHAEAMRISGFNRFLAKNLLGGKILGQASWDRAISHLETAASIDSTRIFHRLDLARVLVDRKRYRDARRHLTAIGALPDRVAHDRVYRAEAAALLESIAKRRDRDSTTS